MSPTNVLILLQKELRDGLRNRWLWLFAVALGVLALALGGLALSQTGGVLGFSRTVAGLVNLTLLLVPLLGLALGAQSVAGERERHILPYLLAQPLSRAELLLGKYLGLVLALGAALGLGFGAAGLALAQTRLEPIVYDRNLRVVGAEVDHSLYMAAQSQGVPDKIISDVADILGWEIDFGRELDQGARVRVVYEELTRLDTAETIPGRVLAVAVDNRGERTEGFFYKMPDGSHAGYYNREGEGLGFADAAVMDNDREKTVRSAVVLANSLPDSSIVIFTRRGTMASYVAGQRPKKAPR